MTLGNEKSPRSATNTSGLFGEVSKGLPNHLNTCLGEDGEYYHFAVFGEVKTLQPSDGGGHGPLTFEDRTCSPLRPPPLWPLGVGVPALAVSPRTT